VSAALGSRRLSPEPRVLCPPIPGMWLGSAV
jgi:hypothetical protein